MKPISLYDIIELIVDIPGTPLRAGMTGTVIDSFPSGAFEVEFEELEEDSDDIVSYGIEPAQIRLRSAYSDQSLKNEVFEPIK